MFPDPTRHHLMGRISTDERKSLWKKGNNALFPEPMPSPREALSKYGESDSAWRQNRPKMLSLFGRKIEARESAVTFGQNCCQVTAKSGVFDCTYAGNCVYPGGCIISPDFDIGYAGTDSKTG